MLNTLVQVPVIDFATFRNGDEAEKQAVARQIKEAFRDIGFIYLRNHGIPQELIARAFNHAQNFFDLPLSDKVKLAWSDEANYLLKSGYIAPEREGLDVDKPGDLKEVLDVGKNVMNTWNLPPNQEPFRQTTQEFYQACTQTVNQILSAFAIALDLPESFFADKHNHDDHELRFLHYPPVMQTPKPGQIRSGEHTDYGSVTLVFQDEMGGLEVLTKQGEWITAPYIPDTVVVNTGDLMQRWTNHMFSSNRHRVVVPENANALQSRYSIVFFCHPNSDVEIHCLETCQDADHPALYPPVRAGDYILGLLQETIETN